MADYQDDMLGIQYQAKLKYRFLVHIDGIPTYLCTQAGRPKWNTSQVQYDYLNMRHYSAGKTTYDPINITVVDAYTPSGANAIQAWLRSKHEPLSGRDAYASNYMKDMTIHVLGPSGDVQESWKFLNCWVTNADYGDLDMSDQNSKMQITLTIRYDKYIKQF